MNKKPVPKSGLMLEKSKWGWAVVKDHEELGLFPKKEMVELFLLNVSAVWDMKK